MRTNLVCGELISKMSLDSLGLRALIVGVQECLMVQENQNYRPSGFRDRCHKISEHYRD